MDGVGWGQERIPGIKRLSSCSMPTAAPKGGQARCLVAYVASHPRCASSSSCPPCCPPSGGAGHQPHSGLHSRVLPGVGGGGQGLAEVARTSWWVGGDCRDAGRERTPGACGGTLRQCRPPAAHHHHTNAHEAAIFPACRSPTPYACLPVHSRAPRAALPGSPGTPDAAPQPAVRPGCHPLQVISHRPAAPAQHDRGGAAAGPRAWPRAAAAPCPGRQPRCVVVGRCCLLLRARTFHQFWQRRLRRRA